MADAPTSMSLLIFLWTPKSQPSNILYMVLGRFKPIENCTTLQINFTKWESRKRKRCYTVCNLPWLGALELTDERLTCHAQSLSPHNCPIRCEHTHTNRESRLLHSLACGQIAAQQSAAGHQIDSHNTYQLMGEFSRGRSRQQQQ